MPPVHQAQQAKNAWRVLFVLFLANLLNFYDRTIPAIIIEPIRLEWDLSDFQLGLASTAFTMVYALAGIPLGRLADIGSRRKIMGWGLTVWSGMTAATGLASSFMSFLLIRMGVGLGEASYAPASNSLIGDLFPAHKRARAVGLFMLGLPFGLLLAYFTTGAIVEAFDSWRAPFFIAAIPGVIVAFFIFRINEPLRGAAESVALSVTPIEKPMRRIVRIPTFLWLTVAGLSFNFAAYACTSFMVPMLMRYFLMPLSQAAIAAGVIVGVTGLIGLTLGGPIADRLHQRSATGRLMFAAISMFIACAATTYALYIGRVETGLFVGIFSLGWLFSYNYFTCVYPALQDVVEPRLRGTAMALFFAALYIFGGCFGPLAVGLLSDHFSASAMLASGSLLMTEAFKAEGLHAAMYLIPGALLVTGLALVKASGHFVADSAAMRNSMAP
ncbi:putative MFS family arabinose efflux permease [Paraperlucidibaca baekdonensis]|uniref:Putative MFS family arabinose efflux permease n=1 Tax=Paraperlucidibaca baekdonensis TaxID=748120 RepID=A0A3E0H577_9GAMM|nr:MFS transporter [Paraperlucidibaca baekdonensis]REH38691.1 putative MFS family arabinose efflux permease [Paraperlucidibaca baekdonensis]